MKIKHIICTLTVFGAVIVVAQLYAQQTETDHKLLKEIRVKAEKGDAESQVALGGAFSHGELGLMKDYVAAAKWYRKAAEQNDAAGESNLGFCYVNGKGVTKDEVEAVKWYRRAAEQDFAEAQSDLGLHYFNGQGVARDYVEAVKWYRRAAEQNLAKAQYNLGICYFKGQGVAKDEAEAVKWYRKAAEQNLARAQSDLGFCCYNGRGVAKDEAGPCNGGAKLPCRIWPRLKAIWPSATMKVAV